MRALLLNRGPSGLLLALLTLMASSCRLPPLPLELADLRNMVSRPLTAEIDRLASGYMEAAQRDLKGAERAYGSRDLEEASYLSQLGTLHYRIAQTIYERLRLERERAQLEQKAERMRAELARIRQGSRSIAPDLQARIKRLGSTSRQSETKAEGAVEELRVMVGLIRALGLGEGEPLLRGQESLDKAMASLEAKRFDEAFGLAREERKMLQPLLPPGKGEVWKELFERLEGLALGPVREDALGVRVEVRDLFQGRSALLADEAPSRLKALATVAMEGGIPLLVKAFVDGVGKTAPNLKLTKDQAMAVGEGLSEAGLKRENIIAAGLGDLQPLEDNRTEEGRAMNRRVEITFLRKAK